MIAYALLALALIGTLASTVFLALVLLAARRFRKMRAQVTELLRSRMGGIEIREAPRRAGDPEQLVASSQAAMRELCWRPALTGLDEMVRSAWTWRLAHPHGHATP
ncbi:MAG: hypothetical protein ACRD2Y_05110 [Terriglobales bacterium]